LRALVDNWSLAARKLNFHSEELVSCEHSCGCDFFVNIVLFTDTVLDFMSTEQHSLAIFHLIPIAGLDYSCEMSYISKLVK